MIYLNPIIASLIEDNLFQYLKYFSYNTNGYLHDGFDEKWIYSGSKNFNNVIYSKYSVTEASSKIAAILDKFLKWNTPLTWFITSSSEPHNLGKLLAENGFMILDALSGMLLCLNDLPKAFIPEHQIEIREVSDLDTLLIWAEVLASGFGATGTNVDAFKSSFVTLGIECRRPWRHYIALLDGTPVSTCTLFNSGAITGIYWVATLDRYRKKGIATYMLWHVLKSAHDNGHKHIVLQATKSGKGVYESLGFKEYCEIFTYRWIPR